MDRILLLPNVWSKTGKHVKDVLIVIVFMTLNQGKLELHWCKTNKFLCIVNSISRQSVSSDSFICSDFFQIFLPWKTDIPHMSFWLLYLYISLI